MHQCLTGPAVYQNPGRQDITCDVNYSDLIQWGEELGMKTLSLRSQAEFLQPFCDGSDADTFLQSSAGAGGAFQVLLQELPGAQ